MTPENFCYWLQGYFEIQDKSQVTYEPMSQAQVDTIRNHLNLVFHHALETTSDNLDKLVEDIKERVLEDGSTYCDRHHKEKRIMC